MTKPITRDNVEALLDSHCLQTLMRNGRWWSIRRNGATRRWKRDPSRLYIPIKFGLRSCFAITESDFNSDHVLADYYRIDPNSSQAQA